MIKGTVQGTVTSNSGNYSLTNIPDDGILVFSFVGMKTQEVVIGNQATINVAMAEDAIGLEEVVAVGYGTMKKSDIVGSISSVSSGKAGRKLFAQYFSGNAGSCAGNQYFKGQWRTGIFRKYSDQGDHIYLCQ